MGNNKIHEEYLWNVHNYLNEHVRFADTKAALVIAWTSGVIGIMFTGGFPEDVSCSFNGALSVIGFVFLTFAFSAAFYSVFPRLESTAEPGFIFWRNILLHKNTSAFADALAAETSEELTRHLAVHVYQLADVCNRKFRVVNVSIVCACVGSVLGAGAFLFW